MNEQTKPINSAKALYDYTRQTDEEVSFSEDADLMVYDVSDPDWTLVGVNSDFGFAPSNYIEIAEDHAAAASPVATTPAYVEEPPAPALPQRPAEVAADEPDVLRSSLTAETAQNPAAAAIANILHQQHSSAVPEPVSSKPIPPTQLPGRHSTSESRDDDDDEGPPPALPRRPPSEVITSAIEPSDASSRPRTHISRLTEDGHVQESPPYNRVGEPVPRSPSGYHLYNVNEMVEVMGRRKKMPTTLGINVATGTIFISPEGDDRQQEWTAERLTHYSIEGKHVFLDLVRPSKSVDLHAGAKDTAQEIVAALGEIAGGYRAEGLREVLAAGAGGGGQKKGQILYDFMAQGDDEVTVAVGDEVIIVDDTKSSEWWMVRRLRNGKEGVVPSSYVEFTGFVPAQSSGVESGLSLVERNRLEEARLAKATMRKSRTDSIDSRASEVGARVKIPRRRSSLKFREVDNNVSQRHKRGDSRNDKSKPSKLTISSFSRLFFGRRCNMLTESSEPDPAQTRQWTDRTKTFTVDAQFIGLHDGKIHLHKVNGVKIAVPIAKMSVEDLEYVEKVTGVSLDEEKPLSDVRRRSVIKNGKAGASVEAPKVPEYDWFDFFLRAGVGPHQCERYSQNFIKDSMDESVLPDITPDTLRTLGLKEGDILRVMRYLDNTLGRTGSKSKLRNVSFGGEEVIGNGEDGSPGGLFSGPGGILHNNTRKGRPVPNVQASDVVDPKAFEQKDANKKESPVAAIDEKPVERGFDDDAWEVKHPKSTPTPTAPPSSPPPSATAPAAAPSTASPVTSQPPAQKQLTGALADLSLLHPPLQPTPAHTAPPAAPTITPAAPTVPQPVPAAVQSPQQTGASPAFFSQLVQPPQQPMQTGVQTFSPQSTGFQQQNIPSRQRPQPPQNLGQNSFLPPPPPPPPQRPLSAPQNFPQPNGFAPPPLQPQLTGMPLSGPPLAPPGQSLSELNQQRFQQSIQPQQSGFVGNQFQNGFMPQQTGFAQQPQFGFQQQSQPGLNGQPFQNQTGFQPIASQPTGFSVMQPQQPMQTGINTSLPPPLQPQRTGANGIGSNMPFMSSPPPIPPIPQQPTAAPLVPQKTGPAPPVRFGVKSASANKLTPQPTGLRANLAQASKFHLSYTAQICQLLISLAIISSYEPLWLLTCRC